MIVKVGVFSAQPYEEKAINAEVDSSVDIQYFPVALSESPFHSVTG